MTLIIYPSSREWRIEMDRKEKTAEMQPKVDLRGKVAGHDYLTISTWSPVRKPAAFASSVSMCISRA